MKKKKFNKKLELNKETITSLDSNGMKKVKGGETFLCGILQPRSLAGHQPRCIEGINEE